MGSRASYTARTFLAWAPTMVLTPRRRAAARAAPRAAARALPRVAPPQCARPANPAALAGRHCTHVQGHQWRACVPRKGKRRAVDVPR
eukprot:7377989-Prymnesium_polylepis.1